MKSLRKVRVQITEINYGVVELAVPDNATEDEIQAAAHHEVERNGAYWFNSCVDVKSIEEDGRTDTMLLASYFNKRN